MGEKMFKCKNCGAPLKQQSDGTYKCEYCLSRFRLKNSESRKKDSLDELAKKVDAAKLKAEEAEYKKKAYENDPKNYIIECIVIFAALQNDKAATKQMTMCRRL